MHLAEKEFPTPIPILKPKEASAQVFTPSGPAAQACMEHFSEYAAPTCSRSNMTCDAQCCHCVPLRPLPSLFFAGPAAQACMEHLSDYAAPTCSRSCDAQCCHCVPLRPLPSLFFADDAGQQVNVANSIVPSFLCQCPSSSIRKIAGIRRRIVITGPDTLSPSTPPDVCCLELNTGGPEQLYAGKSFHDIHSEELSGFSKWQRPQPEKVEPLHVGRTSCQDCCYLNREDHEGGECIPSVKKPKQDASNGLEVSTVEGHAEGTEDSSPGHEVGLDCLHGIFKLKGLFVAANIQEKNLVEFLRAKKQHKDHFLDEIVVNADVYHSHPWHYTGGDTKAIYFCCITKYAKRGNTTRDRMTREGGRWKQQGIVQPIVTAKGYGPATKTYLSYIPRGKLSNCKGYFIHANPGRVKHRHRMIEIALEEDLKSEKRCLKHKVTPKPFLVVCVLRKP